MSTDLRSDTMTEGVIYKQILLFFFPTLFGTLFQQLYNTVDAIIVGQYVGKQALAAVGGGTGIAINLLIGFFVGLSSGATVIISQYFGARKENDVRDAIHNACAIAIWGGLGISALGYIVSDPILRIIGTPSDIFPLASSYIHIYFAGAVFIVIYNIGSSIFRAFGDSKSPLVFLIIGCVANIILDVIFVGILSLGVRGAAYATVLSQAISCMFIVSRLRRRTDCTRLEYSRIRFKDHMLRSTVRIGLPAGIQSVCYSLSNLLVQSNINFFGTDTAAAWSAYGKIDCLFWMVINSLGIAISVFVGQNFGAGLYERSRKGVRDALWISLALTLIVDSVVILLGPYMLSLFSTDTEVISIGVRMIRNIAPLYFTYVCVEVLSGAIRGTGKTIISSAITLVSICGLRAVYLSVFPRLYPVLETVTSVYPISWTLCSVLFIIYYHRGNIFPKENRS